MIDADGTESALLEEFGGLAGTRVLEVGCGDGRVTMLVASRTRSVLAIDSDRKLIASARRALPRELAGRVRYERRGIEDLDVPAGVFDTVLFSHSL